MGRLREINKENGVGGRERERGPGISLEKAQENLNIKREMC